MSINIGEKLRKIRNDRGLSIYRLHQLTDISQNHINGIELGKRMPSIELVERLITPLGVSLAELFNNDTETFYLTSDEKQILKSFRVMSDKQREVFLSLSGVLGE